MFVNFIFKYAAKGLFLIGGCIAGIIACVCKFNFASPRPHFMEICFPNDTKVQLDSCKSKLFWSPFKECSNDNPKEVVEAMKAFPSYHAALAVYA